MHAICTHYIFVGKPFLFAYNLVRRKATLVLEDRDQHCTMHAAVSMEDQGGQRRTSLQTQVRTSTCWCEPALGETEVPCCSAQRISTCTAQCREGITGTHSKQCMRRAQQSPIEGRKRAAVLAKGSTTILARRDRHHKQIVRLAGGQC